MLSPRAVRRGCWRAAKSPVSGADSQMIFCSGLNIGWAEPPAKPRITASLVVRKAPLSLSLSKAYILGETNCDYENYNYCIYNINVFHRLRIISVNKRHQITIPTVVHPPILNCIMTFHSLVSKRYQQVTHHPVEALSLPMTHNTRTTYVISI